MKGSLRRSFSILAIGAVVAACTGNSPPASVPSRGRGAVSVRYCVIQLASPLARGEWTFFGLFYYWRLIVA